MDELIEFLVNVTVQVWQKIKKNAVLIVVFSIPPALLLMPALYVKCPWNSMDGIVGRPILLLLTFIAVYIYYVTIKNIKIDASFFKTYFKFISFGKPFVAFLSISVLTGLIVAVFFAPQIFFHFYPLLKEKIVYYALFQFFPIFAILSLFITLPNFIVFIFNVFEGKNFKDAETHAFELCGSHKKEIFFLFFTILLIMLGLNIVNAAFALLFPTVMLFLGEAYAQLDKIGTLNESGMPSFGKEDTGFAKADLPADPKQRPVFSRVRAEEPEADFSSFSQKKSGNSYGDLPSKKNVRPTDPRIQYNDDISVAARRSAPSSAREEQQIRRPVQSEEQYRKPAAAPVSRSNGEQQYRKPVMPLKNEHEIEIDKPVPTEEQYKKPAAAPAGEQFRKPSVSAGGEHEIEISKPGISLSEEQKKPSVTPVIAQPDNKPVTPSKEAALPAKPEVSLTEEQKKTAAPPVAAPANKEQESKPAAAAVNKPEAVSPAKTEEISKLVNVVSAEASNKSDAVPAAPAASAAATSSSAEQGKQSVTPAAPAAASKPSEGKSPMQNLRRPSFGTSVPSSAAAASADTTASGVKERNPYYDNEPQKNTRPSERERNTQYQAPGDNAPEFENQQRYNNSFSGEREIPGSDHKNVIIAQREKKLITDEQQQQVPEKFAGQERENIPYIATAAMKRHEEPEEEMADFSSAGDISNYINKHGGQLKTSSGLLPEHKKPQHVSDYGSDDDDEPKEKEVSLSDIFDFSDRPEEETEKDLGDGRAEELYNEMKEMQVIEIFDEETLEKEEKKAGRSPLVVEDLMSGFDAEEVRSKRREVVEEHNERGRDIVIESSSADNMVELITDDDDDEYSEPAQAKKSEKRYSSLDDYGYIDIKKKK